MTLIPEDATQLPNGMIDFDLGSYIPFLLHQAHRGTVMVFEGDLRRFDVSLSEWRAIAVLAHHGSLRFGDLAQLAGLEPPTLARQLKAMETKGWVLRQPSAEDGRGTDISITPKGLALAADILPLTEKATALALRGFTPDEQAFLRGLLRRVQMNLATPDAP